MAFQGELVTIGGLFRTRIHLAVLTLLTNARVFTPLPLGYRNLLIAGGRIVAISEQPLEATGAIIHDCNGQRLVPGFIDGHAHITGGGGEAGFKTRVPAPFLSHFTSAGVTSVVGVLGTDDTTRDTRSLVAQAYALREEGLGAWCHTGGYHIPLATLTGNVKDDIVFLDPVIGVGELALSDHRSSQPALGELLRIASEAYVAGLITGKAGIVHLHLGDGDRGLDLVLKALRTSELPARVFNPTHINRRKALFDEALEVASNGSTVDITAFPVSEQDDGWSADMALIRYLDSGAPEANITISSDGGGCLPAFNAQGEVTSMDIGSSASLPQTLEKLLARGVPLETALPAFTSNVADILRLSDRGRISVGNHADLILLDESGGIDSVMADGIWHVEHKHQLISGEFEEKR